jgi:CBS domain-containing protein
MKTQVKELMTRDCRACDPSESLATAALRMWEADCGILPVVAGGRVRGAITDRDICMALALKDRRPSELAVGDVMSGELWTAEADDEVVAALATIARHKVRRLPVLEAGRLAGMLSMNDIVNCLGENPDLRQPILSTLESLSAHRTLPSVPEAA